MTKNDKDKLLAILEKELSASEAKFAEKMRISGDFIKKGSFGNAVIARAGADNAVGEIAAIKRIILMVYGWPEE